MTNINLEIKHHEPINQGGAEFTDKCGKCGTEFYRPDSAPSTSPCCSVGSHPLVVSPMFACPGLPDSKEFARCIHEYLARL